MPLQQVANGNGAFADAANHHVTTGFDSFCDRDFTFARQQFNRAHFAQVHAHRVVGAANIVFVDVATRVAFRFGRLVGFGRLAGFGFFLFLGFDDIDAHFREHRHHVFDLLRGHFLGRQRCVQFVVSDIATLFGFLNQLLDVLIGRIQQRLVAGRCNFKRFTIFSDGHGGRFAGQELCNSSRFQIKGFACGCFGGGRF